MGNIAEKGFVLVLVDEFDRGVGYSVGDHRLVSGIWNMGNRLFPLHPLQGRVVPFWVPVCRDPHVVGVRDALVFIESLGNPAYKLGDDKSPSCYWVLHNFSLTPTALVRYPFNRIQFPQVQPMKTIYSLLSVLLFLGPLPHLSAIPNAECEKPTASKAAKVYRPPIGKPYPAHWGAPPLRQTRDLRTLPGGYGRGSGTLARWIQENLARDARLKPIPAPAPVRELAAPAPIRAPVAPAVPSAVVDQAKVSLLKKSLKTWSKLKKECTGNYSYRKRWSSWVGFGHETEVVVRDNKVVERRYKSFPGRPREVAPGQPPSQPKGKSWVEKGSELGSHKEGHPARTLDELYAEARTILSRPVSQFERLGLRVDKQGLLLACYTQDKRIADDAPTKGVNISSITLAPKGSGKSAAVPPTGANRTEIHKLEQEIVRMKGFAKRARFTPDRHKKFLTELAGLEKTLAELKSGGSGVPTYEEWLKGGKKIPPGMVFTGGSPWFNERTGQKRQPREVFNMIFNRKPEGAPLIRQKPKLPSTPFTGSRFPAHWGSPPLLQTKDLRTLPGGYGRGSSTLVGWILKNMEKDRKNPKTNN